MCFGYSGMACTHLCLVVYTEHMEEEFELTYLVARLPDGYERSHSNEILDIYIPASAAHPTLRIRHCGDVFEITKKEPVSGTDSSHQIENTIPLTEEEFEDLSQLPGKRVRKIRYYYNDGAQDYEIDVFQDGLEGLVTIDVEFASNEEKARFTPPDWLGADVTQETFIAGGMLCGKTYSDIRADLERCGYVAP